VEVAKFLPAIVAIATVLFVLFQPLLERLRPCNIFGHDWAWKYDAPGSCEGADICKKCGNQIRGIQHVLGGTRYEGDSQTDYRDYRVKGCARYSYVILELV